MMYDCYRHCRRRDPSTDRRRRRNRNRRNRRRRRRRTHPPDASLPRRWFFTAKLGPEHRREHTHVLQQVFVDTQSWTSEDRSL